MRVAFVLAVALLFVGCGSKQPPASPETKEGHPQEAHPLEDKRPVIVAFGDSLSEGHGVREGQSYPDFLQRELDRRGYAYRVENAGISGDTTSGGLARVQTVVDMKPAIVILELGANDGLRGLPIASTRANLEQITQGLQKAGSGWFWRG